MVGAEGCEGVCMYVCTYLFREIIDQLTVDEAVDAVTDNLLTPDR
jgi:hypothetical protein